MVSSRTRPGTTEFRHLTDSARRSVLFIQVARAAVFADDRLHLEDLEPTTIWFTRDRGERFGHMATGTFLDVWWHPDSGLSGAALHAVLGRADPDAQLLADPVLRLSSPRIRGSGLEYEAELLSGSTAGIRGACVLFLGPGDADDEQEPDPVTERPATLWL